MKRRTVHGIALDGNGNSERACTVELSGPVKNIPSSDDMEGLRDEIVGMLRHLSMSAGDQAREERGSLRRNNNSDKFLGQEQAYSHSSDVVEEMFSALLSKIKN